MVCKFDIAETFLHGICFCLYICIYKYPNISWCINVVFVICLISTSVFFAKYLRTLFFYRPSLNSFYWSYRLFNITVKSGDLDYIHMKLRTTFNLCKAPVTHVLQPVGDCLATKKQLQPMQSLCDQNCIFSVGDQSATGRRQLSLKSGDQSATGGRLVANWLEMGCDWSATGWRLVGDRSAMGWRLTIDQTICSIGVIMNKALISYYSMAISISIMSYCLVSFDIIIN